MIASSLRLMLDQIDQVSADDHWTRAYRHLVEAFRRAVDLYHHVDRPTISGQWKTHKPRPVLCENVVCNMRQLRKRGWTYLMIADRHGVKVSTARDAVNGLTWMDVKERHGVS